MKTPNSIPTSHPNWIDEDEYHDQAKSNRWRKRIGISFPVAFALVLGLHLAVVGAFYSLGSTKKKIPDPPAEVKPVGPKSDALSRNDWPQTNAVTKVVAKPPAPAPKSTPARIAKKTMNPAVPQKPVEPLKKPAPAVVEKKPTLPQKVATASSPDVEELKKTFISTRETAAPTTEIRQAIPVERIARAIPVNDGEASVPPASPQAPARNEGVRREVARPASDYTLQAGDNLYMVSRKLGVSFQDLMRANGLTDPRQLRVGQKLKVPESQTTASL